MVPTSSTPQRANEDVSRETLQGAAEPVNSVVAWKSGRLHASSLTFSSAPYRLIAGQMRSNVITTEPFDPHAATPAGLEWEVHAGRVPLERLAALIPSFTSLIADAPTGEVDRPPNRYDLQGYVAGYENADRSGGEHLLVMLLDGSSVAGMCEGWWDARFPNRVSQYLTAVARPWRGRGLAKALKARMLRLAREQQPGVAMMSNYNAVSNAPMLSINARLGFVRHKEIGTYQIRRGTLAEWLETHPSRPGALITA